ncbi:MAG: STAS domain-containing protein [Pseudomonadales bacterium]|nr:STAS domain-containing protein [Pseudomonadales bacterium]
MSMKEHSLNGFKAISLAGDFDAHTVEQTRTEFANLIEADSENLVFDMADVKFIDSSGIGALVFLFKRLAVEKRTMCLVGLSGQPARLISLLRIDQVIETHDSMSHFLKQSDKQFTQPATVGS